MLSRRAASGQHIRPEHMPTRGLRRVTARHQPYPLLEPPSRYMLIEIAPAFEGTP